MQENYINLCTFNFGKRCYIIMKNHNVKYFEKIDGKYQIPITSFKLYDNEGKSLTYVNQHFFMNQLVNIINTACKKGFLISDNEISNYLEEIKEKITNDEELKNILKGSLMNEIDEENFEKNKKRIIDYINNFEIKTFVDYNNVSVFNGNIDKNTNDIIEEKNIEPNQTVEINNFIEENQMPEEPNYFDFGTNAFSNNNDILNKTENIDINDEEYILVEEQPKTSENNIQSNENLTQTPIIEIEKEPINTNLIEENVEPIQPQQNVEQTQPQQNIEQINQQQNNERIEPQPQKNINYIKNNLNNNIENLQSENNSYIKQVQNRIMNNNPEYNAINKNNLNNYSNEMAIDQTNFSVNNITNETKFEDKTINDKDTLKDLEDLTVNIQPVELPKEPKKENKGKNIIITILVILMVVASSFAFCFFIM